MKKIILMCFAFMAICFSQSLNAQNNASKSLQPITYSSNVYNDLTSQELMFLTEVFKDKLEEQILGRPYMLLAYKNLLRNRIVIKESNNQTSSNKVKNLNEIPLFTVYNSQLTRDVTYNKNTFNVLKYDLPFFAPGGSIYKIPNSSYILVIKPQTTRK